MNCEHFYSTLKGQFMFKGLLGKQGQYIFTVLSKVNMRLQLLFGQTNALWRLQLATKNFFSNF